MYLIWVLATTVLCTIFRTTSAYDQHCIDPANCRFYPIHGCYATEAGLVCNSRTQGGFEMSIDPLYTFFYAPYNERNDTGAPCFTIPITAELISYVDLRGPKVIDLDDLDLIGNCSRMSYCHPKSKTCQPKLPLGSSCRYNMQCYFGIDGIPGHCANKSVCAIREDLPQYYYNTPRWTMGDQWQAAVIAVLATGGVAACLVIGRAQVSKLAGSFKVMMEKWQNPDHSAMAQQQVVMQPFVENEQAWNEHHLEQQRWWKQVPGVNWVYSKFKRGENGQYYQLDNRGESAQQVVEEPPPYRPD